MCVIERDGKVVIIDQTAEIERLQKAISEPVTSFGTPELIEWANEMQKIIVDFPESERGDLPFVMRMGCHLEKFVKSWHCHTLEKQAARIQELEAVLKEADQYRRASLDRVMKIANQLDDLKTLNDALMENGNDLRARAQKAEARITELEAQVAALQEIAIEERAKYEALAGRYVDDWEELDEEDDSALVEENIHGKRFFRDEARRQLSEEHPEAFR